MLVVMKTPYNDDGVVVDPQKVCSIECAFDGTLSDVVISKTTFIGGSSVMVLGSPREVAQALDNVMVQAAQAAAGPLVVKPPPGLRAV